MSKFDYAINKDIAFIGVVVLVISALVGIGTFFAGVAHGRKVAESMYSWNRAEHKHTHWCKEKKSAAAIRRTSQAHR